MNALKDITGTKGWDLRGKRIILCLTGSVAIVRSVELARELMRLGAEVYPVMSQAAQELVCPALFEWATGNKPVTKLTGECEHVQYCGKRGSADLVLICPCTGNTLSKLAWGVDDTPVTTFAVTALGSHIPIVIVPAMHESMYTNKKILDNIEKVKGMGIRVVEPVLKEGKAKMAETGEILKAVVSELRGRNLKGKNVLITAGPTVEYIDPVRVITNLSSGKMGVELAREAMTRGAKVTLIYGPGSEPPVGDKIINVMTTEDMLRAVEKELKETRYDVVFMTAAPADYTPDRKEPDKISTKNMEVTLKLKSTPKITGAVRKLAPRAFFIGFKAEYRKERSELIRRGKSKMLSDHMDMIVVNDVGQKGTGFRTETNAGYIITKSGKTEEIPLCSKREFAGRIMDYVR